MKVLKVSILNVHIKPVSLSVFGAIGAHRDRDNIPLLLEGKVVSNWIGWNLPPNATH
jgi:hypothetical protein